MIAATMHYISRAPLIIVYAILLHAGYGFLLVFFDVPQAIALIGGYDWLLNLGQDSAGMILILLAFLAAMGLVLGSRISRLESAALFLPQYSVLLYALIMGVVKLVDGIEVTNSQGATVDVPFATTAAALGPICVAAALHTVALAARFADPFYEYDRRELVEEIHEWKARAVVAEAALESRGATYGH